MTYAEPTNLTGITGMFGYANSVTENFFVPMSLIALWLIIFLWLLFRHYDAAECATTAGFITALAAVFYRVATYNGVPLINDFYFYLAVLSLLLPVVWLFFKKR